MVDLDSSDEPVAKRRRTVPRRKVPVVSSISDSDESFIDNSPKAAPKPAPKRRTKAAKPTSDSEEIQKTKVKGAARGKKAQGTQRASAAAASDSDDSVIKKKGASKAAPKRKAKASSAKKSTTGKKNTTASKSRNSVNNDKAKAKPKAKPKPKPKRDTEKANNRIWNKYGQKTFTPPQGDGSRVYYESTYEQSPNSYIAIRYMIENGCLETGSLQLEEAYEKYCALKEGGAFRRLGGVKPEFDAVLKKITLKYQKQINKLNGTNIIKNEP